MGTVDKGQTYRNSALCAVLVAGAVALAGCAAASVDAPSCEDVLTQASYEVMSQLAASGAAADPAALRAAMPGEVTDAVDAGNVVELPSYEVFTNDYSDAEQAELRSALVSSSVGVGEVFDEDGFYSSMAGDGVCAGSLTG